MSRLPYDEELAKTEKIAHHFKEILRLLEQDIDSEGLRETPLRVAKYYQEFLLGWETGKTESLFEAIQTDQMVIVKDIPFWSLCEHHVLPWWGKATVGYLTGSKVIGLSKIPRIVQKYAHKLQLQERLAHQIADDLQQLLEDSPGCAILIEGEHTCMQARGIRSPGKMIASVLRGVFREDQAVKEEFLLLTRG